jgi:phosphohistidine phosphatase
MNLLVIRHAIAEERAPGDGPDELRRLTSDGRRKMRRVARGLRHEVGALRLVATSPLVRAVETARIVADEYGMSEIEVLEELAPGVPLEGALGWIDEHWKRSREMTPVAIVGHEPHLGSLVTWLLSGRETSFLELRKGGACLLEFASSPAPGNATLRWMLAASQLRGLR